MNKICYIGTTGRKPRKNEIFGRKILGDHDSSYKSKKTNYTTYALYCRKDVNYVQQYLIDEVLGGTDYAKVLEQMYRAKFSEWVVNEYN